MSLHVVVIGAVATGPKAACRFKRLMPEGRVTLIDKGKRISYGGCGIPYYVSGEINRVEELQSTPYGTLRDAAFFRAAKGVDVLTDTEVTAIDRSKKRLSLLDHTSGKASELEYDRLVLATGSSPLIPPLPGRELEGITAASTLEEAECIKNSVARGGVNRAVVIGGGFIGLEMAVAFADMWGIPTTVVELREQILSGFLSRDFARMAAKDLVDNGVNLLTGEKVLRFEGEQGKVTRVVTDKRIIPAELVVLATGARPNTSLAAAAGLELTERGWMVVDEYLRTSDLDIYAGGDCVALRNQITGKPFWLPLGSQANRQGRIIGSNLAGGKERFSGAVGSWGIKLFKESASGAGLTLETALAAGYDALSVQVQQIDKAHFYPEHAMMALEAVIDKPSRRLLGVQGVGAGGDALVGRINAVVPLLANHATVSDLSTLEVVYSPPFASAMDIVNALGNVAENTLEGRSRTLSPEEFQALWNNRASGQVCILDARARNDALPYNEAFPGEWLNIPQDELARRIDELPRDKPLVLVCNTGLRAYEAQRVLDSLGRGDSRSVAGGLSAVGRMGFGILPGKK